ncbi:hypothetical protein BCR39DRAFT_548623 [Naematelia encephala]|uniref:Uncharacterized protein n=1 Tax=Naematelia encephala TaxID=71784 RepID=A0A1Y2AMM1_9TREE|nr:hypothetical protein BCR39DRAFT_548623 [Naematelia encephala]
MKNDYIREFERRLMRASGHLIVDLSREEASRDLDWDFPLPALTRVTVIVGSDLTTKNHFQERPRRSSTSQRPRRDDGLGTDENPTARESLDRLVDLTGVKLLIDIPRFSVPETIPRFPHAPYNDVGHASSLRSEDTTLSFERADPTAVATWLSLMSVRLFKQLAINPHAKVTIILPRSMKIDTGQSHEDTEESTRNSQLSEEVSLRVWRRLGTPHIDGSTQFDPEAYLKNYLLYASNQASVSTIDDQGKELSKREATSDDATRIFEQFTFEYK